MARVVAAWWLLCLMEATAAPGVNNNPSTAQRGDGSRKLLAQLARDSTWDVAGNGARQMGGATAEDPTWPSARTIPQASRHLLQQRQASMDCKLRLWGEPRYGGLVYSFPTPYEWFEGGAMQCDDVSMEQARNNWAESFALRCTCTGLGSTSCFELARSVTLLLRDGDTAALSGSSSSSSSTPSPSPSPATVATADDDVDDMYDLNDDPVLTITFTPESCVNSGAGNYCERYLVDLRQVPVVRNDSGLAYVDMSDNISSFKLCLGFPPSPPPSPQPSAPSSPSLPPPRPTPPRPSPPRPTPPRPSPPRPTPPRPSPPRPNPPRLPPPSPSILKPPDTPTTPPSSPSPPLGPRMPPAPISPPPLAQPPSPPPVTSNADPSLITLNPGPNHMNSSHALCPPPSLTLNPAFPPSSAPAPSAPRSPPASASGSPPQFLSQPSPLVALDLFTGGDCPKPEVTLIQLNAFRAVHSGSPLTWDSSLAGSAQTWADYLASDTTFHSGCSLISSPEAQAQASPVGESMYTWYTPDVYTCTNAVQDLYTIGQQAYQYTATPYHDNLPIMSTIQGYAQMLWRNAQHVGCGRGSGWDADGNTCYVVVCHYDISINTVDNDWLRNIRPAIMI